MENIQKLKNNKILFIGLFIIFVLFILSTTSRASIEFTDTDNITHTLPDLPDTITGLDNTYTISDYDNMIITNGTYYRIFLYTNNENICNVSNFSSSNPNNIYVSNLYSYLVLRCTDGTNYTFERVSTSTSPSTNTSDVFLSKDILVYSNLDIYDDNNELVFQAPVQEVTLAQVLEEEQEDNPSLALTQILAILPMILVVVVSFLGLRKALQMLSTVLHRA